MITSAADERSRVILLPFPPDAEEPAVVLKLSRRHDFNVHSEREQAALTELRSILDESMKQSIPKPIAMLSRGKLVVGVESYNPGRSLSSTSGRWQGSTKRKTSDLLLASRWLGDFHSQAQVSREPWGPDHIASFVEMPLATYTQTFGPTPNEQRLFKAVRHRASAMLGKPFPIVWQHHDFGEWNIYRVRDQIRVIDWERAKTGPALCDLLWFVAHWHIIAQNIRGDQGQLNAFRELFLDPTPLKLSVKAVRQAISEYLSRLEIDSRFFPTFLVVTWAEHALDHFERQQATGAGKENLRGANRYISYVTTLAQHRERLFDAPLAGIG
jgi:Ser/Thr protein kinase RdoA (MazF antagonist)